MCWLLLFLGNCAFVFETWLWPIIIHCHHTMRWVSLAEIPLLCSDTIAIMKHQLCLSLCQKTPRTMSRKAQGRYRVLPQPCTAPRRSEMVDDIGLVGYRNFHRNKHYIHWIRCHCVRALDNGWLWYPDLCTFPLFEFHKRQIYNKV